jgi:hypothetical protein
VNKRWQETLRSSFRIETFLNICSVVLRGLLSNALQATAYTTLNRKLFGMRGMLTGRLVAFLLGCSPLLSTSFEGLVPDQQQPL